ncbi:MAG TPA: biopolymer transporter ExbD [Vicinamibacterales bacterium]|jgi:biopolymer transport protein ExbD|nr:biopolymer transporter ExbD [Vicinamibacterales bacterium]
MPKVQAQASSGTGRGRGRRVSSSLAEINVVPLVDVMLVLLIIFMITAPMIQRGMDVKVPISTRASQIEGDRVFVTVPADFGQTHTVLLGTERLGIDALQERVRQKVEQATDKKVYLQGDGHALYQDVYDVFDRLKDAGVTEVGLVARAPGER